MKYNRGLRLTQRSYQYETEDSTRGRASKHPLPISDGGAEVASDEPDGGASMPRRSLHPPNVVVGVAPRRMPASGGSKRPSGISKNPTQPPPAKSRCTASNADEIFTFHDIVANDAITTDEWGDDGPDHQLAEPGMFIVYTCQQRSVPKGGRRCPIRKHKSFNVNLGIGDGAFDMQLEQLVDRTCPGHCGIPPKIEYFALNRCVVCYKGFDLEAGKVFKTTPTAVADCVYRYDSALGAKSFKALTCLIRPLPPALRTLSDNALDDMMHSSGERLFKGAFSPEGLQAADTLTHDGCVYSGPEAAEAFPSMARVPPATIGAAASSSNAAHVAPVAVAAPAVHRAQAPAEEDILEVEAEVEDDDDEDEEVVEVEDDDDEEQRAAPAAATASPQHTPGSSSDSCFVESFDVLQKVAPAPRHYVDSAKDELTRSAGAIREALVGGGSGDRAVGAITYSKNLATSLRRPERDAADHPASAPTHEPVRQDLAFAGDINNPTWGYPKPKRRPASDEEVASDLSCVNAALESTIPTTPAEEAELAVAARTRQ